MGSLYLKKGDLAKAEDFIKTSPGQGAGFRECSYAHGRLFANGKKIMKGAEREYRKAVELSPAASMAHIKLAEFYMIDNNLAEAKKILSESTANSPDFLPASFYLARIAFAEKDYRWIDQTARRDFTKKCRIMSMP